MPEKDIIVTAPNRGIGFGLTWAFLSHGCTVTVSGRGEEAVDLKERFVHWRSRLN